MGISTGAQVLLDSDKPVDPPEEPMRPSPPAEGEPLTADAETIVTAVYPEGKLSAAGLGDLVLEGSFSPDNNSFRATVFQAK